MIEDKLKIKWFRRLFLGYAGVMALVTFMVRESIFPALFSGAFGFLFILFWYLLWIRQDCRRC